MPAPTERVQVVKQESSGLGGDAADAAEYLNAPISPEEDAVEVAGVFLQEAGARDTSVLFWRESGVAFVKDTSETTGSAVLNRLKHRALRALVHFIDSGPADGFASGAYREITGGAFPTAVIWYTNDTKSHKIVELTITRDASQQPTTETWKMYDTDGSTVLATVTDTITYSGPFEASRTRVIG